MFTSFSWQQYLLAVLSLATVYYGAILLLYYRDEIALFFKKGKRNGLNSKTPTLSSRTVLGEAKADHNVASISNDELLFNSEEEAN